MQAFQPDGSLTPTTASSSLYSLRGKAVVVVVANKGESGPVVSSLSALRAVLRAKSSYNL